MEAKDGDFSAIAWPGFVDILSTVIMMFLFFIMIVSIVMYVMSMEFKKNLQKESKKQVEVKVSAELEKYVKMITNGEITPEELEKRLQKSDKVEELDQQNRRLVHENTALTDAIEQIKADLASGLAQSVKVDQNNFVIMYEKNDISLSKETSDLLEKYVKAYVTDKKVDPKDVHITLISSDNPNAPTITVSRELGLARSLNIRNSMLGLQVPPENISVQYVDPQKLEESYNWVRVEISRQSEHPQPKPQQQNGQ